MPSTIFQKQKLIYCITKEGAYFFSRGFEEPTIIAIRPWEFQVRNRR